MKPWLYLPLIVLAGCCAPKRGTVMVKPLPDVDAQAQWSTSVRYPEIVKRYHVGRHVDSRDESLLYEAHPFFRIESPARWNLHPDPNCGEPPPIAITSLPNPAHVTPTLNDESVAELNRQKEITRAVMQQADSLNNTLQGLTSALAVTRSLAEQNQVLRAQLTNALQRLDALEQQARSATTSLPTKDDPLQ